MRIIFHLSDAFRDINPTTNYLRTKFYSSTWLIINGSDLLGLSLVKKLYKFGISSFSLVDKSIDQSKLEFIKRYGGNIIYGNVENPQTYENYLPTIDVICHNTSNYLILDTKTDFHPNIEGTKILVDKMKEYGIKKMIYVSSAVVYEKIQTKEITEESITQKHDNVSKFYLRNEEIILSNKNYLFPTIIRLPIIFGDPSISQNILPYLVRLKSRSLIQKIFSDGSMFSLVHVADAVNFILQIGVMRKTPSIIYNITSFSLSYDQITNMCKKLSLDHFDVSFENIIIKVKEISNFVPFMSPRISNQLIIHRYKGTNKISTKRAEKEIGWIARHRDSKELEIYILQYYKIIGEIIEFNTDIRELITQEKQSSDF